MADWNIFFQVEDELQFLQEAKSTHTAVTN